MDSQNPIYPSDIESPPKDKVVAGILGILLGGLGIHRFYVGKAGTGILMILTLGGLGIWVIIDLVMILTGGFKDSEGKDLQR